MASGDFSIKVEVGIRWNMWDHCTTGYLLYLWIHRKRMNQMELWIVRYDMEGIWFQIFNHMKFGIQRFYSDVLLGKGSDYL